MAENNAELLIRTPPKSIKQRLSDGHEFDHLVVVDASWRRTAIDLEVGDGIVLQSGMHDVAPRMLRPLAMSTGGQLLQAVCPGVVRYGGPSTTTAGLIRIAPRHFEGLADYRFLSDDGLSEEAA